MDKLDTLESKIENIEKAMKQQTAQINLELKDQTFTELAQYLETVGDAYGEYVRKDSGARGKLISRFLDVDDHFNHLEAHIGKYFRAIQAVEYGSCVSLSKIRLVKLKLGNRCPPIR